MADNAEQDEEDKDEGEDQKASQAEEKAEAKAEEKAEAKAEEKAEAKAEAKAEDKAEAKPAKKAEAAPAKKPAAKAADGKNPAKKGGTKGKKAEVKRAEPPSSASLGKSMVLFVVVVGTLAAGFALLGQERGGGAGPKGPAWKVGDKVDVEITLVAGDKRELSCASSEEVAGRHCGFEAPNKPWTKGDNTDDKKLLRPYTSTDNAQFVAAGLWSEPTLAGNLPVTRFSVKCKYTVEGKIKAPTFHWESGWEGQPRGDMLAGVVSECKLQP